MKTTVKTAPYSTVMARPRPEHKMPKKPALFWRILIRLLTVFGMAGTGFKLETEGMEKIAKGEPCLILMNHSCFLDMQIAYRALFPRAFCIICTSDAFVGLGGLMNWLLRQIGCIPTQKFVTDVSLIKDMTYALKQHPHVSGGQLFLRWPLHGAAPENGRAAEKAGCAGADDRDLWRFFPQSAVQ